MSVLMVHNLFYCILKEWLISVCVGNVSCKSNCICLKGCITCTVYHFRGDLCSDMDTFPQLAVVLPRNTFDLLSKDIFKPIKYMEERVYFLPVQLFVSSFVFATQCVRMFWSRQLSCK